MDPSCITGPLWEMTKSLCGSLKNEAAHVYNLEENLQSLEEKSQKLEDMKKDVEANIEVVEISREMQRSHQVRGWLKRVVSIQQEIKDIHVRRTKQIQSKCLGKCPKNCLASYKLGKDIAKILRNVDELEIEGEGFCKDFKIALKRLHKAIAMPSGETVGLDLMFDKVWKSIEEKDVGIIGLYGMGGVGKTTLLKKINNELGKRSDFFIVWVVVSKSPNLDSIMDNIRKRAGIDDNLWERCSNQDVKAAKIYEVLKEKKFVLLLDDIWKKLDLEKMGVPHPKETNFQSKVLFTTRFEDVCAKMEAQRKFKVEVLTEKEALQLFLMKVGEETLESNPNIQNIAKEMAKECKGLPLALTVVGSAMAGVKSVEAWEHSRNNLTSSSWTASDWEISVFSILKLSYDQLPDEAHKKCFLYCALYPEDYEIRVDNLIYKWIGEGFLDNDRSVHGKRSYAGSIIEKLKLSCLLESAEDVIVLDRSVELPTVIHYHQDYFLFEGAEDDIVLKRSIKMHDVIRDMALWIARDEDRNKKKVIVQEDVLAMSEANNVENWEMAERISIMKGVSSCIQSIAWTNLITLLLRFVGSSYRVISGLGNIQYARRLKVLELIAVPDVSNQFYSKKYSVPMPTGIGSLNLLEYLSMSGFDASDEISREFKNLKNLKFFHLNTDRGGVWPLGLISYLQRLKVFGFGFEYAGEEEEILEELERSSSLEELRMQIRTKSGLNKLFESTKVQSCTSRFELSLIDTQVNGTLLLATMSKMKQLQRLVLKSLADVIDPVFDTCCRLSTLQTVRIYNCGTIHHLTWLKNAPLLQELAVEACWSMEQVIKGSEILQDDDEKDSVFSSLVVLLLSKLPNLRSIHERVLSFPSLRSIQVHRCGNLNRLPFDSNSGRAEWRLISGSQEWWDTLEWDDPSVKATFQSKFQELFS